MKDSIVDAQIVSNNRLKVSSSPVSPGRIAMSAQNESVNPASVDYRIRGRKLGSGASRNNPKVMENISLASSSLHSKSLKRKRSVNYIAHHEIGGFGDYVQNLNEKSLNSRWNAPWTTNISKTSVRE